MQMACVLRHGTDKDREAVCQGISESLVLIVPRVYTGSHEK